jgi:hypothetical protein
MRVDGDEAAEQRFFRSDALPLGAMPVWYRAMWADAAAPRPSAAFDPAETGPPGAPSMPELLPGETGLLAPVAAAVVSLPDGRVLVCDSPGGPMLPLAALRLGESAAARAAAAVSETLGTPLEPSRLLGILSRPRNLGAAWSGLVQPVVAAFQFVAPAEAPAGSGRWADPTVLPGAADVALLLAAVNGPAHLD